MSDELLAFVRACIDREERAALAAAEQDPAPWANKVDAEPGGYTSGRIADANGYTVVHVEDQTPGFATAEHMALHDPASVLARVASDRAILADHKPSYGEGGPACGRCSADEHDQYGMGWWMPYPCPTVAAMTQRYAGRDGWQEEWRA